MFYHENSTDYGFLLGPFQDSANMRELEQRRNLGGCVCEEQVWVQPRWACKASICSSTGTVLKLPMVSPLEPTLPPTVAPKPEERITSVHIHRKHSRLKN